MPQGEFDCTGARGVMHYLSSHMVKDGKQHTVKDARPEGQGEGRAMELEGVKQHFQRAVSDVWPWVERQL